MQILLSQCFVVYVDFISHFNSTIIQTHYVFNLIINFILKATDCVTGKKHLRFRVLLLLI